MKKQKFIALGAKLGSTVVGAGYGAVKGGIDAYKGTGKKMQEPVQSAVNKPSKKDK